MIIYLKISLLLIYQSALKIVLWYTTDHNTMIWAISEINEVREDIKYLNSKPK